MSVQETTSSGTCREYVSERRSSSEDQKAWSWGKYFKRGEIGDDKIAMVAASRIRSELFGMLRWHLRRRGVQPRPDQWVSYVETAGDWAILIKSLRAMLSRLKPDAVFLLETKRTRDGKLKKLGYFLVRFQIVWAMLEALVCCGRRM